MLPFLVNGCTDASRFLPPPVPTPKGPSCTISAEKADEALDALEVIDAELFRDEDPAPIPVPIATTEPEAGPAAALPVLFLDRKLVLDLARCRLWDADIDDDRDVLRIIVAMSGDGDLGEADLGPDERVAGTGGGPIGIGGTAGRAFMRDRRTDGLGIAPAVFRDADVEDGGGGGGLDGGGSGGGS